jgi:ribonuclease HI
MAKQKWYVVLKGRKPGIYSVWEDAKAQVAGFPAPVFKGFESKEQAEQAWKLRKFPHQNENIAVQAGSSGKTSPKKPEGYFVVVDAACSGVPGPTEYQGFLMPEKKLLFSVHIGQATNNLGEFLGIVHALAYLKKADSGLPVYSDSVTALSWVLRKQVKSSLQRDASTEHAWQLVDRALSWLKENPVSNRLCKWETTFWGENPADFGRK